MGIFTVTYSDATYANVAEVGHAIKEIEHWPKWDKKLHRCSLQEGHLCTAGSTYYLSPEAGNKEIAAKIEKVVEDKNLFEFVDVATLALGEVRTIRKVEAVNENLSIITQTMIVTLSRPDLVPAFDNNFWPAWSQGMIEATKGLARHAENSRLYTAHLNIKT